MAMLELLQKLSKQLIGLDHKSKNILFRGRLLRPSARAIRRALVNVKETAYKMSVKHPMWAMIEQWVLFIYLGLL